MTKLQLLKQIDKDVIKLWPEGCLFDGYEPKLEGMITALAKVRTILKKYQRKLNSKS